MTDLLDIKVLVQPTPNPFAYKFVVNREVKATGNVTYTNKEECGANKLALALFENVPGMRQLYFFENVITMTFAAGTDMIEAEGKAIETIKAGILDHNPLFEVGNEEERRSKLSPELRQIEEILDRTIRPGLQGDGGDLEVVGLMDNQLAVRYQGACGSCPSSTMGTLMAIQGILREQFDPDIEVVPV